MELEQYIYFSSVVEEYKMKYIAEGKFVAARDEDRRVKFGKKCSQ